MHRLGPGQPRLDDFFAFKLGRTEQWRDQVADPRLRATLSDQQRQLGRIHHWLGWIVWRRLRIWLRQLIELGQQFSWGVLITLHHPALPQTRLDLHPVAHLIGQPQSHCLTGCQPGFGGHQTP
ncbi:hypothetical protein D3C71_1347080 [compost metagenome]